MKNALFILFFSFSSIAFSQNYQWAIGVGGSGSDGVNAVATDAAGNVYVTGVFQGLVDFDPGVGIVNLTAVAAGNTFIQKLDASGNLLWVKQISGTSSQGEFITLDGMGNIYVSGGFKGTVDLDPGTGTLDVSAGSEFNFYVVKLDADGELLWGKSASGPGSIFPRSLATNASGEVVITGNFELEADFDPGSGTAVITATGERDAFILKYDAAGTFQWVKQLENNNINQGKSLAVDDSGNIYVTGKFWDTTDFDPGAGVQNLTAVGADDTFLLKLDASGDFSWVKQFGGDGYEYGFTVAVGPMGNLYMIGGFEETVDFDPGSGTLELTSAGAGDVFILKLDAAGDLVWAKQIGGTSIDGGYYLAVDGLGQIYLTGTFASTADLDPGSGVMEVTSAGFSDVYVEKLDTDGNLQWVKTIGGTGFDTGLFVAVNWTGALYCAGIYASTVDFDPDAGVAELTSVGSFDGYVLKLDVGTVSSIADTDMNSNLTAYPNPAKDLVTITGLDLADGTISIYDISGKEVTSMVTLLQIGNQGMEIDLSRLPAGIYTLKVGSQIGKIYKQ